jgi:hypothetical protein
MAKEIWHIDNVTQECGWFTSNTDVNNHYGCLHPEQEDVEEEDEEHNHRRGIHGPPPFHCGRCFTFTCPLGAELNPSEEPEDAEEFRKHGDDPAQFSDGEWMLVDVEDGRLVGAASDTDCDGSPDV